MTDANTSSSTAFSTPFSHLQHLLILGWKTGQSQDKAEPGRDRTRGRKRGAPGADETERERERKRWCSWTCSSTTAADDGCTRRITASSEFGREKRKVERERERESGALLGVTLAELRPDATKTKRETERGSSTEGLIIACLMC